MNDGASMGSGVGGSRVKIFPNRKQTARVAREGNSHRWGDTVVREVAVASAVSGSGGGVVAVLLFPPWLLVRPVGGWLVVGGETKYRVKYRAKTSSISTPNRGGFALYFDSVFFADVS